MTVDTFLSDTSTNPVQNRAIKAYVDSVDNQLEEKIGNLVERIDSLENGTSGGAGAVIFDATCSSDPWNLNVLQTETTVEEMAEAVEYLVRAEWTTGSILTADGGLVLGVTHA